MFGTGDMALSYLHVFTKKYAPLFVFVSAVLIGGSHSLPLASWMTFVLSCFLLLLYR